ncbi:MAG: ribosome maturation factor RimM [Silicimonas sp.]|jgi:16S rRNA processing protein RimM|nr:ribosome maturation factor RimM [Silicimonas sp.]
MTERVCVGAIAGSFGVKGEVRLKSFCAEPEDIASYGPLTDERGGERWDIRITRPIKNGFAARLSGVSTKETADALRGTRLYAPRDALPNLPDDEFYHADLIGLTVLDTGGAEIGRIKAILNHGAGDLLEIVAEGQPQTVLLPFTKECVPTVDLTASRAIADPPDGLFD